MDAFIELLLSRLVASSLQMTVLGSAVWALCRFVPRISPSAQCWLWWLVALQALIGLAAPPVELPWLPQATVTLLEAATATATDVNTIPVAGVAAINSLAAAPISLPTILFLLWIGGLLVMAWSMVRDWRRGRRLLNYSSYCTDVHLLRTLACTAAATGLRAAPVLRLSDSIHSPILVGHIRPALLLPAATSLSSEELEMALRHELAHLRRGDLWWGWIPSLARQLFFFHPFMHLAVREYGISREAACDAAVVAAGHRSRRDYGRLLLRLGTSRDSDVGLAAAASTLHALRRRLTMLQHTSFLSRTSSIALVSLVAATGVLPLHVVAAAKAPVANAPVAAEPVLANPPAPPATREKMDVATASPIPAAPPAPSVTSTPADVTARKGANVFPAIAPDDSTPPAMTVGAQPTTNINGTIMIQLNREFQVTAGKMSLNAATGETTLDGNVHFKFSGGEIGGEHFVMTHGEEGIIVKIVGTDPLSIQSDMIKSSEETAR